MVRTSRHSLLRSSSRRCRRLWGPVGGLNYETVNRFISPLIKRSTSIRGGDDLASALFESPARYRDRPKRPRSTSGDWLGCNPLELSGLTIKVHYPQQGAPSPPPAVIVAAGSAKIDRCAFQVTGDSSVKGSRALVSDGGVLEVNRTWFQGFDETINIIAMTNTSARIRQTMIVPTFGLAQVRPPEWYGWGVKLQLGGGVVERREEPAIPPYP